MIVLNKAVRSPFKYIQWNVILYDFATHPHPFLKYTLASSPLMVKILYYFILFTLFSPYVLISISQPL